MTVDDAIELIAATCKGRHAFASDPANRYAVDMLAWMPRNRDNHGALYVAGSLDAMVGIGSDRLAPEVSSACFMIAEVIKFGQPTLSAAIASQIKGCNIKLGAMLKQRAQALVDA